MRRLAKRLVGLDEVTTEQTIICKASHILAAEKVEGDYLEFGVYSGGSFIEAFHTMRAVYQHHQQINSGRSQEDADKIGAIWRERRFFAFDSFEGLPASEGIDKMSDDFFAGKYSFSEDDFRAKIADHGVPKEKSVIVPGWYNQSCTEETIRKHSMKKAAVVHIDCDLYESTRDALNFVTPLLTDGTIIIFDDWFCFRGNPELGEQKAFSEWTALLPDWTFSEYQKEGPWSISFIANQRIVTSD
jgi:hypothetical protein